MCIATGSGEAVTGRDVVCQDTSHRSHQAQHDVKTRRRVVLTLEKLNVAHGPKRFTLLEQLICRSTLPKPT